MYQTIHKRLCIATPSKTTLKPNVDYVRNADKRTIFSKGSTSIWKGIIGN